MNNFNIKIIQSLKNKKNRIENKLFIVEGKRLLKSALHHKKIIKEIYFTETFKIKNNSIFKKIKELKISNKKISEKHLKKISFTKNPPGIIALCKILESKKINFVKNKWVYLDNISDPGNLGTILRSASWFNFKNIALSKNCVDPYNPKVIRSSMGSIFNVSIQIGIDLQKFPDDYVILGTDKKGIKFNNFTIPKRFVLIIGNEANGISKKNINSIKQMIKIKKLGDGESLNAATAASIIMYEFSK